MKISPRGASVQINYDFSPVLLILKGNSRRVRLSSPLVEASYNIRKAVPRGGKEGGDGG